MCAAGLAAAQVRSDCRSNMQFSIRAGAGKKRIALLLNSLVLMLMRGAEAVQSRGCAESQRVGSARYQASDLVDCASKTSQEQSGYRSRIGKSSSSGSKVGDEQSMIAIEKVAVV